MSFCKTTALICALAALSGCGGSKIAARNAQDMSAEAFVHSGSDLLENHLEVPDLAAEDPNFPDIDPGIYADGHPATSDVALTIA